jgi:hypothetical protein
MLPTRCMMMGSAKSGPGAAIRKALPLSRGREVWRTRLAGPGLGRFFAFFDRPSRGRGPRAGVRYYPLSSLARTTTTTTSERFGSPSASPRRRGVRRAPPRSTGGAKRHRGLARGPPPLPLALLGAILSPPPRPAVFPPWRLIIRSGSSPKGARGCRGRFPPEVPRATPHPLCRDAAGDRARPTGSRPGRVPGRPLRGGAALLETPRGFRSQHENASAVSVPAPPRTPGAREFRLRTVLFGRRFELAIV